LVPEVLLLWHPRLRFSQKIGCALYRCLENEERGRKDKDGAHTVGKTRAMAAGHALVPILGKEQGEHSEKRLTATFLPRLLRLLVSILG